MKVLAVNPEVKKALLADRTLFLMYVALYGQYDTDIEPLHNPDWCERQRIHETEGLKELQDMREKFEKLFVHLNNEEVKWFGEGI